MKKIIIFLIGLNFLLSAGALAQKKTNIDSLISFSKIYTKDDSIALKNLITIGKEILNQNPASSLEYFERARSIAEKSGLPYWQAESMRLRGISKIRIGKFAEALIDLELAKLAILKIKDETMLGKCLENIGAAYAYQSQAENALNNFEQALTIYEKINNLKLQAQVIGSIATLSLNNKMPEKALSFFQRSMAICDKIGDTRTNLFNYANIVALYVNKSEYAKALEYNLKALEYSGKFGNKETVAQITANMGNIYYRLGDSKKALEYDTKALDLYKEVGIKEHIARCYVNLGTRFLNQRDYSKALEYNQKAFELLEKSSDKVMFATCIGNLGTINYKIKKYPQALEYHKKALDLFEQLKDDDGISRSHFSIGAIYTNASDTELSKEGLNAASRFQLADDEFQKAMKIAIAIEELNTQSKILEKQSQLFEQKGDFKTAYEIYQKYIILKDSITGEDVKNQITRKEIQFEFDKKEAVFKYQQQLSDQLVLNQKSVIIQQQQALSLKEQTLLLQQKQKDLQQLAFLKVKAEKQENEQKLLLAEKEKENQANELLNLAKEKALQLQILAKKNALISLLMLAIAFLLLSAFAYYLWLRQKQAKKEAQSQLKFTQQLLTNIEEERGRIARDLHDGINQSLLVIKRDLFSGSQNKDASVKIDLVMNEVRDISRNLHPVMLESIGLKLGLETLCYQYMEGSDQFIAQELEYNNSLPIHKELQIFRIVQEALMNIIKYAEAKACKVSIKEDNDRITLTIQDNGKGFDVKKVMESGSAFGLHSILQRAKIIGGEAQIESSENGTIIRVSTDKIINTTQYN